MLGAILCVANVVVVGLAGYMGWHKYLHDLKNRPTQAVLTQSKMNIVNGVMTDRRFESTNSVRWSLWCGVAEAPAAAHTQNCPNSRSSVLCVGLTAALLRLARTPTHLAPPCLSPLNRC